MKWTLVKLSELKPTKWELVGTLPDDYEERKQRLEQAINHHETNLKRAKEKYRLFLEKTYD